MYINQMGIMEINAYYDRKGGMRTANVDNYANAVSFAQLMQRAAGQRSGLTRLAARNDTATASGAMHSAHAAAQDKATDRAESSTASGSTWAGTRTALGSSAASRRATTRKAWSPGASESETTQPDSIQTAQDNGNICCEKCHLTSQLMLQMMTRNLYAQSGMGYPLTGTDALASYQRMAKALGGSLFT